MLQTGAAYIPTDRYYALLENQELAAQERGSALFADISGFTPLTEAYTRLLGARRGAEELTHQLNLIYDAIIGDVKRYGGSVISFSGDAITCWFGEHWPAEVSNVPAARAVACGQAILHTMQMFSELKLPSGSLVNLGIKVSVASGIARRFLVGDPAIQYWDLLAGDPVERMIDGERLIGKGELILDTATAEEIEPLVEIAEWRSAEHSDEQFAVVAKIRGQVEPLLWQDTTRSTLSEATLRSWVLPSVSERIQRGAEAAHAELRPVVAFFLRFVGIDSNDPAAGVQLDGFVRWTQKILAQYDGTLLQVTLGDKGSYLYAAFGAPSAHEDNARRAVTAALEMRIPPAGLECIDYIQIGISQGIMRVGDYGGTTRRTYGVLGDEVNVAARLMQHARAGEVLATTAIQQATSSEFNWEPLPPLRVKGKSNTIAVSRLVSKFTVRQQASFTTSLVGREAQLRQLSDFLEPLWHKQFAGVAYVIGEAGMGKSRLLHELRSQMRVKHDFFWISCISDEIFRDSLQPLRHALREYFSQSPEQSFEENMTRFSDVMDVLLGELDQANRVDLREKLSRARSFLAAMVDLYWEGSPYAAAEPRLRFEGIIEALTTLIQTESVRQPVIIHIEDGQWLDADSIELLKIWCDQFDGYPVSILMTCRSFEDGNLSKLRNEAPVRSETCNLKELSQEGIQALSREILSGEVSSQLSAFLLAKTSGNPLFVEQLILDLRERKLLKQEDNTNWVLSEVASVEVPSTVSAVLIARLDRLMTKVRAVVQMASVLGQEFEVRVLSTMLADDPEVPDLVEAAETAAVWSPSREGFYNFRHALLRDAAYDMQLSARQQELHRSAAEALEIVYGSEVTSQATELAYHYEQAQDNIKAANWYTTAGDNSLKTYALENVISYYRKALNCWEKQGENSEASRKLRLQVLLNLGNALRWRNRSVEAMQVLRDAYSEAEALGDETGESDACTGLAAVQYDEGDFRVALENATRAEQIALRQGVSRRLRTVLEMKCWCLFRLGNLEAARVAGERAVEVSTELNELGQLAQSLSVLGLVLMALGQNQQAVEHFEHALAIAHDPMDVVGVTNNLGVIAVAQGDYERAALRFEEALALARKHNIAEAELVFQSNLGGAHVGLGYFELAEMELREVIRVNGDSSFGDLSETYRFLAESLIGQNRLDDAREAAQRALILAREVAAPEFIAIAWRVLGQIASRSPLPLQLLGMPGDELREYTAADCFAESLKICEETGMNGELPRTLRAWAFHELGRGNRDAGARMWRRAMEAFEAIGAVKEVERMHSQTNFDDLTL